MSILNSESEITINWFIDNYMILNTAKFQAIISDKRKVNYTNQNVNINQKEIRVSEYPQKTSILKNTSFVESLCSFSTETKKQYVSLFEIQF